MPSVLRVGLVAVAVLLLAGGVALLGRPDTADDPFGAGASPTVQGKHSSGIDSSPSPSTEETEETEEREEDNGVDPSSIPSSGSGTFTTAEGDGTLIGGSKTVVTYRVQVEDGIEGISPEEVAEEVAGIFDDPRGWKTDDGTGFRQVSGDTSDMRIRLATAETVDDICGQYGLDTGGEVNCRVGQDVMVNLKRWLLATEYYADDVKEYRALIINHEVGHFLGYGHETCPGPGKPAPAMMQQIKGLKGCVPNAWPYDGDGRRITGPSVP